MSILRRYGFHVELDKSVRANAARIFGEQRTADYFSTPQNMAFHNLCDSTTNVPAGTRELLGLGLKYCIEPPQPKQYHGHTVHTSLDRFSRSVRLHTQIGRRQPNLPEETTRDGITQTRYIPGLYIPSPYQPRHSSFGIEEPLSRFRNEVERILRDLPSHRRYNLTPQQRRCLSELRSRRDLIVFPTDKNLGPSIADRTRYIKQVLAEHLGKTTRYEFLDPTQASHELTAQRAHFVALYSRFKGTLPTEAERTYFARALTDDYLDRTRPPQFYGTFKVHKDGANLRPIVSCVNSIPEIFSKWVDYWLKTVVRTFLPSYLRDVEHLLSDFASYFPNGLPPNARLFSMDAVGMYMNIDTDHGLEQVGEFLLAHRDLMPRGMPLNFIRASLHAIMSNNILQFGDTTWRQISGCAMGTSAAVNYSYLYVGRLETHILLKRYQANLLYYKRFIDDVIGVWMDDPAHPEAWDDFFRDLNNYGKLRWTTTGFTDHLTFMDLDINILPDGSIHTSTHQKELNLYLYIPKGSAHSPSMLRGLVYGRLRAYKLHNTDPKDFDHYTCLLAKRLQARGWDSRTLNKLFREALARLDSCKNHLPQKKQRTNKKRLFFHLPYHPRGVTRQQIRQAYERHLGTVLPDCSLTIAVSRPRNIGDRVCSTVLPSVPGDNPSDHLSGGDR